ncbi:MAG: ABC transporter ATP-binding protein [Clostridia bacterium]|nr:ABC transporter ATP-binding protein [Clostridia bacterium]
MIKCENILKKYSDRTVLSIPQLEIKSGESVCLTGANGSGKSTLLKIIAGVIPFEGKLEAQGSILYMPQKSLCFDMSVLSNVTYSLSGKKKDKEEIAFEALKKVGLEALYKKNASGLSGGEAARLSLARLLVHECDILLLDEPTGAVDIEGTEIIENAVKSFVKENKCTLITATHSPLQAKRMSDRVIMLEKGEKVEDSSPEELLIAPKTDFGKKFVDMWRY